MSKHLSDIVQCRKLAGIGIGRVCVVHDGRCVGCDSYFNLQTPAHVCDECHFLSTAAQRRCLVCNSLAVADAFYCRNCTMLEKDRDGCPTVINLAQDRIDTHYKKQK
ncbi:PHF5-like protein, partial [Ramicandelaber brevisporus]